VKISGETLVDVLRGRAIQEPDRLAFSFLPSGETEESRFTYAELDLRARAIGAWLSSASALGDRVLLLSPSGPEFVSAVFGCLYRGAAAVPAYPLDPARIGSTLSRLRQILEDAKPVVALTAASSLAFVEDLVRIHPPCTRRLSIASQPHSKTAAFAVRHSIADMGLRKPPCWSAIRRSPRTPEFYEWKGRLSNGMT
jgi:acyl-CoA synthetase (AMP-forming)/AMP-acid ligase II